LNKKSAQKQKRLVTTASRKPLFHKKRHDQKHTHKSQNQKPGPHEKRAFYFAGASSNDNTL
jgi:hypothetical protein